jgi:hypothetical protein
MKLNTKDYYAPTPTRWRKIGDSILIFGTTLTATFAGIEVGKEWVIAAAIMTALGKVLTNVFTEEADATQ